MWIYTCASIKRCALITRLLGFLSQGHPVDTGWLCLEGPTAVPLKAHLSPAALHLGTATSIDHIKCPAQRPPLPTVSGPEKRRFQLGFNIDALHWLTCLTARTDQPPY